MAVFQNEDAVFRNAAPPLGNPQLMNLILVVVGRLKKHHFITVKG
jgi:hypothetical protein